MAFMSGHSKWSTIKRQKGINDAKRGQVFTKLGNAISVAVREGGGGDPANNIRLRLAVDIARSQNMPKDNIDRAIDRGLGKTGGAALESVMYEGFGPAGIAVLVAAFTDNRNRTTAEVKTIFEKAGGSMGQPGSVSWQFDNVGEIVVAINNGNAEEISLLAIDAGAQDVRQEDDIILVYTSPDKLNSVRQNIMDLNLDIESAQLVMIAKETLKITDSENIEKIDRFLEKLQDLDDVNDVYTNTSYDSI
jgi:YebC/PmpR family DNA-binding regulatory protein